MRMRVILLAILFVSGSALAAPETEAAWDCKFTQRTLCTAAGCAPGKGHTWIYLTPGQQGYWRCGGASFEDCDEYKATVTNSGAYKIFELPGHAAFAKVGPDLTVTEVLSMMDGVWINRGKCIIGPPPLIRVR